MATHTYDYLGEVAMQGNLGDRLLPPHVRTFTHLLPVFLSAGLSAAPSELPPRLSRGRYRASPSPQSVCTATIASQRLRRIHPAQAWEETGWKREAGLPW